MSIRKHIIAYAAVLSIAVPTTAHLEGLSLTPYLDDAGILTICHGETEGVAPTDVHTPKECDQMLRAKLGYVAWQIDRMVKPDMPASRHAALSSWAYNVGLGAAGRSTLVRKMNNGDVYGACAELGKWVCVSTAAGSGDMNGRCATRARDKKISKGLVRRRAEERRLCEVGGV